MSVTCSSQGSRAGGEDLFQQSPELVIVQRAETDYDLSWLTIMRGTAPGSVDSLPVRICSSLEGCSSCRRRFPLEFRRDVVAVARKGEAPLSQIAKDFGISESCLHRWLKIADVDDGVRPGVTSSESAELRELKKRNKMLEQENEILRRAAAYFARESSPK